MYDYERYDYEGYDYSPYDDVASKKERTWAMLCHLSAFSVYIGIPLGNILGPLIMWLLKKDESYFIDRQGREAINFHLSMSIYCFFAGVFSVILIGIPFLIALIISSFVLTIIAAVKANDGFPYRYPMTIRFL